MIMKILLAEDDQAIQRVCKMTLEDGGHKVDVAGDGEEAVEKWRQGEYDLVLMDLQMPRMDGISAAGAIRREESAKGERVPIVGLTAFKDSDTLLQCGKVDMDDVLAKPLRLESLRLTLEELRQASGNAAGPPEPERACGPQGQVIDLDELIDSMGESDARVLANVFVEQVSRYLESLERAMGEKDHGESRRLAHQIKGTASQFTAAGLSSSARQLEELIIKEDFESSLMQIEAIKKEFRDVSSYLKGKLLSD